MLATVLIKAQSEYPFRFFSSVVPTQVASKQMVIQPAAANNIAACDGVIPNNSGRKQVIGKPVPIAELFKKAKSAGVIQGCVEGAFIAGFGSKIYVVVVLGVIVYFPGIGVVIIGSRVGAEEVYGIRRGFVRYTQIAVIVVQQICF